MWMQTLCTESQNVLRKFSWVRCYNFVTEWLFLVHDHVVLIQNMHSDIYQFKVNIPWKSLAIPRDNTWYIHMNTLCKHISQVFETVSPTQNEFISNRFYKIANNSHFSVSLYVDACI